LNLDDPGEEDLYMISCGSKYSVAWGYLFPGAITKYFERLSYFENNVLKERWKRAYLYYLKRITKKNDGRPMILKNPPNIARVRHLIEMFPCAKFIYLHRNPFWVFYSTQNLWNNVIARYISLQNISKKEQNELIYNHYQKEMFQSEIDKKLIPEGNLVEIKYEDLIEDPVQQINKIYETLKLPGYESAVDSIKQRLEIEKGYTKSEYNFQDEILDEIHEKWNYFIDKWNYSRPGTKQKVNVH